MHKNDKVYVTDSGTKFRVQPDTTTESNLMQKLNKNDELVLVDEPWIKVSKGGVVGWVRSDLVSTGSPAPVVVLTSNTLPKFILGQKNLANDINTIEVRKQINYEFGHKSDGLSLQCVEYVQWRVKTKLGINIRWPADRPRDGGKWVKIFSKNKMYTILQDPVAGCAVSFTDGVSSNPEINEIGHVAFVEEVLGDGSVRVSEVNFPKDGLYGERIISRDKLKNQYKAQFVKFV